MRHDRGKQAGYLVADLEKNSQCRDKHMVQAGREPVVSRLGLSIAPRWLAQPEFFAAACVDAVRGFN